VIIPEAPLITCRVSAWPAIHTNIGTISN